MRSNIVLVLGPFIPSPDQIFSGENGPGGQLFLEFWSPGPIFLPDQNFRDRSRAVLVNGTLTVHSSVCLGDHSIKVATQCTTTAVS